MTSPPSPPTPPSSPPRPIYTPPADDTRVVPPGWLDQAPVTRMLLALNVCVFAAEVVVSRSVTDLSPHLLAMGASSSLATLGEGRYETLVTACFLHAGVVHIAFNMIALWQAGPLVERAVGSARMAPMYLLAGVFGNLLSVLYSWHVGTGGYTVGASGAISGVIAAALVVGWRTGGWRSPLTQAMARWLGFVLLFGVLEHLNGGNIDNAAHVGGGLAGAAIAALWKRGYRYSSSATAGVLAACVGILLACIAIVAIRDRSDPFASMDMQGRVEFTAEAVSDGRCGDAQQGLAAVDRLGGRRDTRHLAGQVRREVEAVCGQQPAPAP